jgi:hypothetical protein
MGKKSPTPKKATGGKKCSKCHRTGHTKTACYATTTNDGIKMETE